MYLSDVENQKEHKLAFKDIKERLYSHQGLPPIFTYMHGVQEQDKEFNTSIRYSSFGGGVLGDVHLSEYRNKEDRYAEDNVEQLTKNYDLRLCVFIESRNKVLTKIKRFLIKLLYMLDVLDY